MEIAQLRILLAVSNAGGFAAAADALDLTPSNVTRAVAKLETSLGVRLLNRTTRTVSLTEAGQDFLTRIVPTLDEIDAAAELARRGTADLTGVLRVSASVSFGQSVIAPALQRFRVEHPHLTIDLILSDAMTDIVADRVAVAVRHGALDDSTLIAQRLRRVSYRLVASPGYLSEAEPIRSPADIEHHPCLTYPYPAFRSEWRFQRESQQEDIEIQPMMRVSNAAALAACATSGMGLALLADWLVDRDIEEGRLVNVLPGWSASGAGTDSDPTLWIVPPSRAFVPAKTKAFVEFLKGIARR